MTKNELVILLTDNYRDVPGDAEVVTVSPVGGSYAKPYVVEQSGNGMQRLLIGAEEVIG